MRIEKCSFHLRSEMVSNSWTDLALNRGRWRALVSAVMNFRV